VRLWTDSSLNENCEISDSNPLDALAHLADGPAGPDERRRAITSDARELRRSAQRALDLQHQCGDMRRRFQQLARPAIERATRIEHEFDPGALPQHDRRMSKTMTLPPGCCADDPSHTATARARTMDRSSCSKRSRTDAGPDATDKARMTDWRSAEAPRRRSAPRPCALLAAAGTYSTSSIAFPSLLDLSARRRHSKGNAKEESARLSGFLREGGSEGRLPMGHPGRRCPVLTAASRQAAMGTLYP